MIRPLLLALLAALLSLPVLADEVDALLSSTKPPPRFGTHKADLSWGRETFTFADGKSQEFYVIKDGARYVAVLHPGMNQLDMITFDPTRTLEKPPFKEYYSWGKLLGVRITTAVWYPEMSASGKVDIAFSGGGSALELTTTQTWAGERNGKSVYSMKLRCDPILGYVWDARTDLAIDKPFVNGKGEPIVPEFFNWQVKVTHMGRRNNQPWPDAWDHERTVFTSTEGKLVGFYINPEANDRSKYKRTEVREGGFVAKLPGPDGWGVALVHAKKGAASVKNATCNMWADQHNLLKLPTTPGADGMHRVSGSWRFLALPPEVVKPLIDQGDYDTLGHT